ncbi:MAG: hypothetical protein ACI9YH_005226 [Colwellia sp.]|jgi:hypothetical protein
MNKCALAIPVRYFLLSLIIFLAPMTSQASLIFINEIHYDNSGADKNEFVELAGTAGLNLLDWSLQFYNGSTGLVYKTFTIGNVTLADNHNGFGFLGFEISGIQNGSSNGIGDGIAVVDSNDQVIQFLSYEGAFEAKDGAALGILSDNISINQNSSPEGKSIQLTTNGNNYNDFEWVIEDNTYGSINIGQSFISEQSPITVQVSEPNLQIPFILLIILLFLSRKELKTPENMKRLIH